MPIVMFMRGSKVAGFDFVDSLSVDVSLFIMLRFASGSHVSCDREIGLAVYKQMRLVYMLCIPSESLLSQFCI